MQQIPAWLLRQYAEAEAAKQSMLAQVAASGVQVPKPEVRGYQEIAMEFSLGEGELYSADRDVTKAIHEFDPYIVPMWCRWVFKAPNSKNVEVFGRWAIGRYVADPKYDKPPVKCSVPVWYKGYIPNTIIDILEGEKDKNFSDIPGKYIPWDWAVYRKLKDAWVDTMDMKAIKKKYIEDPLVAQEVARNARLAEELYRQRDLEEYTRRKMDQISDVEMKEFALHGRKKIGQVAITPRVFMNRSR